MKHCLDRRGFLKAAAGAAAALAFPGCAHAAGASTPMDRVAMTTVTFRFRFAQTRPSGYAGTEPLLTLREVPEYFADRFGVHNLELWSQHFESLSPAYLADVKAAVARARSRLINVQVDQPYNLADADEARRREGVGLVREWIDAARRLGSPRVRANAGQGAEATAVASLRQVNEYGAAQGVEVLTENHGGISVDPEVLTRIVDAIPHPNFGVVADFGNFAPGEDRFPALARLVPRARLVSAKTQLFDAAGNHTSFDFARCVRTAEEAGYRGIYSAEQWDPSREPRDFEAIADYMLRGIRENLRG